MILAYFLLALIQRNRTHRNVQLTHRTDTILENTAKIPHVFVLFHFIHMKNIMSNYITMRMPNESPSLSLYLNLKSKVFAQRHE